MRRAVLLAVLMLALPSTAFANSSLVFTNTGGRVQLKGSTLLGSIQFTGFTESGGTITGSLGHVAYAWYYTLTGTIAGTLGRGVRGGSASGASVQTPFDVSGHVPFWSTVRGYSGSTTASTVPEPGTLGLLGTGLVGIACLVRRKFRRLQLPSTSVR